MAPLAGSINTARSLCSNRFDGLTSGELHLELFIGVDKYCFLV
jgi:hypothetical protein